MNLTLRDIEYFLSVVEHGGMARAADTLGVSQPALSKSLKRLEEETGLALFQRGTRPIRLTSSGLVFTEHARRLRAEYGDAVRTAAELRAGNAGLLRIGAAGATLDTVVLPALGRMFPRRPAMHVQLTTGLSDDLTAKVEEGVLDFAVIPTYGQTRGNVEQLALTAEALHPVAAQDHPLSARTRVSIADLQRERWILPKASSHARRMVEACFIESGLQPPAPALELDFLTDGTLELIRSARLVAAAPANLLPRLAHWRLAPLAATLQSRLQRSLALITRNATVWSPLMKEFRDVVLEHVGPPSRSRASGTFKAS